MKMLFSSKKSQIHIVVLVILTLVICGTALFIFSTQISMQKQTILRSSAAINELYAEEEYYIFLLKNFVKTFPAEISAINIEQEFRNRYAKNADINMNPLFSKYIKEIRIALENPKSKIVKEGSKIKLHLEGFRFSVDEDGIKVVHKRDLDFEINLKTQVS